jgi:hypothetical protein
MVAAIFSLLRLMAMLTAVSLAAVGISVFLVSLVHAAEPSRPLLAQAQVPQPRGGKAVAKSPMTRCMETWDRATQMSKQEWKESCKRTVKEYPGLYDKPF